MSKINVTIMVCLPKEIEKQFYEISESIFKKYGKERLRSTKDGIYYQIPHITLLSLGGCFDQTEEIIKKLESIKFNIQKTILESDKLTCFDDGAECHLVVKMKPNKELTKLHKQIYEILSKFDKCNSEFILDNYTPHITIISSIPSKIGKQLQKEIKIPDFKFELNQIGIKTKKSGEFAKIQKTFNLNI